MVILQHKTNIFYNSLNKKILRLGMISLQKRQHTTYIPGKNTIFGRKQ